MPADTPLHKACHNGDFVQVKVHVEEKGTPIDVPGASDRRPIHRAVGGNHLEIAKYLVDKGASINQTDRSGRSALHWAVISGHITSVIFLIENGADLFAKTRTSMTSLHAAAESGRVDILKILIDSVHDRRNELFDARDDDEKTSYDLAKLNNHKAATKCLKELGDPNAKSKSMCTIS
mmetsp:Transcript_36519/g.85361  ORF Transcript_36519/g.85361 Transcript_36519/m.85361 type:complete len:178 (-) Transcript_36519:112-645(-)